MVAGVVDVGLGVVGVGSVVDGVLVTVGTGGAATGLMTMELEISGVEPSGQELGPLDTLGSLLPGCGEKLTVTGLVTTPRAMGGND